MTTRAPNHFANVATPDGAGELAFEKFVFDLANTGHLPAAAGFAANDLIQIGLVPAGHKLVPTLCRLDMIAIDTDGSPTGDWSVGDSTTPAALKASTASEAAAATYSGEDWALATAEVGAHYVDTPIYIKIINASATTPHTGKIVFYQAIRPWGDGDVDA